MTLDDECSYYNVRRCGNCVRVVITRTQHNTYLAYEVLKDTGEMSEGQPVSRWEHVPGSARGIGDRDPMPLAKEMYERAFERFGCGPFRSETTPFTGVERSLIVRLLRQLDPKEDLIGVFIKHLPSSAYTERGVVDLVKKLGG